MDNTLNWESLVADVSRLSSTGAGVSFDRLRCFHLCRPENVESYYTGGIRLFSRDEINDRFRKLFSDLPGTVIEAAITQCPPYNAPSEVYVGVDRRFLLQHCGHYCVYGSERLIAFSNCLDTRDGRDWRQHLKQIGRPTVIVLDVPFDELPPDDADKLICCVQRVALGNTDDVVMPEMLLDYGISFQRPLPANWVIDHQYPASVFDPLLKELYTYPL